MIGSAGVVFNHYSSSHSVASNVTMGAPVAQSFGDYAFGIFCLFIVIIIMALLIQMLLKGLM